MSAHCIATGYAIFMGILYLQALFFRALHETPPGTCDLAVARIELLRLIDDHKIDRDEAHLGALYENLSILLQGSQRLIATSYGDFAETEGKQLGHDAEVAQALVRMPSHDFPDALRPIMYDVRRALDHLLSKRLSLIIWINSRRRAIARTQREQAKALLEMMSAIPAAPAVS